MQANKTCKIPHILKIIQGQGDLYHSLQSLPGSASSSKCQAEATQKSKRNQFEEFLSNFVQFGVKFLASCTSREYKVILSVFVRNLNCSFSVPDIRCPVLGRGTKDVLRTDITAHNLFTPLLSRPISAKTVQLSTTKLIYKPDYRPSLVLSPSRVCCVGSTLL